MRERSPLPPPLKHYAARGSEKLGAGGAHVGRYCNSIPGLQNPIGPFTLLGTRAVARRPHSFRASCVVDGPMVNGDNHDDSAQESGQREEAMLKEGRWESSTT